MSPEVPTEAPLSLWWGSQQGHSLEVSGHQSSPMIQYRRCLRWLWVARLQIGFQLETNGSLA